jgi:hypothetical protein
VMCSDSRIMMCAEPYWSTPLVVSITGPSISAQELSSEVAGIETISVQTEDLEFIDEQTEENESTDAQTEETVLGSFSLGSFSNDLNYALDAQPEENESIDAQPEENESIGEQTEEDCNFAEDDTYHMASTGNELRISAPGVLENDQYGNDKSLSVLSYTQPAHAANFAMNSDGSFTYTSSQDYCGEDSFTYTIDGDCESNEATVTIIIDCGLQNESEVSLS